MNKKNEMSKMLKSQNLNSQTPLDNKGNNTEVHWNYFLLLEEDLRDILTI